MRGARGVLGVGGMHAIQYRLKRSYWSALKTLNALLEEFSLTAARFDLFTLARAPYGRLQSDLWKELGVSRSVVCRILQKVEKLGWVVRWKPDEDRRQRMVRLTKLGREVFARAGRSPAESEGGARLGLRGRSVVSPSSWVARGGLFAPPGVARPHSSQLPRQRLRSVRMERRG